MKDHDYRKTWETYASAWKAPTAEEKKRLLDQSVDPDCRYTDPVAQTAGHDALIEYMLGFHQQYPGGHFVTTRFLAHHGRSLAHWNMVSGTGEVLSEGVSYGEYRDDGQLVGMNGFFSAEEASA